MTSTSADPRAPGPRRAAAPAAWAGFTLLEIMVTVLIMGLLLPILAAREEATVRAHRAKNLIEALHHAETLLAQRARDVYPVEAQEGLIEEAPLYRFRLTLENFDLSTGLSEDEEEQQDWREDQAVPAEIIPPDADVPTEDQRADPHLVRRFELRISWPHEEEADQERELVLEGYLPRVWQDDPDKLLDEAPAKDP